MAYARKKHGTEGMERLYRRMKELGYNGPADEKEIKVAKWYPMEYNILFLKAYKELFGEKKLSLLAKQTSKNIGIFGMFVKWAANPKLVIKKSSEYWEQFYNFGRLDGRMIDSESAVISGYGISRDPIFCDFLTDYFAGVVEQTGVKSVVSEHTKCVHKGADHEEWIIRWSTSSELKNQNTTYEIEWDSSLESGIEEIDRQHKYFVKILNEINRNIAENTRRTLVATLRFMDRYAHWHFGAEEEYMKKYNYDRYELHRLEHIKFYDYTRKTIQDAEKADVRMETELAFSINRYLIDWLILHIKGSDRRFAEFMRKKGLEMHEEDMPENIMAGLERIR